MRKEAMIHAKSARPKMGTYDIKKTFGEENSRPFPALTSQARVLPDAVDSERIEAAFGKLMRGLAHTSGELTYSGYRELYELGPAVVPALERRIFQATGKRSRGRWRRACRRRW